MGVSSPAVRDDPRERIAGRYCVDGVLGRGGAALVYRVTDGVTQRNLALKQLRLSPGDANYAELAALFEREYQMLAQLSHPGIIQAFDYGVDAGRPYYTMELLDGEDLDALSPMPWQAACELLFEVCSSLALIHSRGLVHRDISPRNIRRTGRGAKLIDFGAMIRMGPSRTVVGTAPFAAPEVVYRAALDARTDLFSLGATLYSVLTGQLAYPARKFQELAAAWGAQPRPPSSHAGDIPPALDALVLSLIAVDPASRPRNAAEVMQRLAAIAGLDRVESTGVTQAYLTTPVLVARGRATLRFRKRLIRALRGRGGGVLISGVAGVGRSRLLDACALDATVMGATVLRGAAAAVPDEPFALAQSLLEQLVEALPELAVSSARAPSDLGSLLFDPASEKAPPVDPGAADRPRLAQLSRAGAALPELQAALHTWVLRIAEQVELVLAVDDLPHADAASLGLIAGLTQAAPTRSLLIVASAGQDAANADAGVAFGLFRQHSASIELGPLERAETQALLGSLFGDVPHLVAISGAVHDLARGIPRECMLLAQHLVETSTISYQGGTWRLPARLDAAALPRSLEDALAQGIAGLDPLARWLAECHALARMERFERADYRTLADGEVTSAVDAAVERLVARRVLASEGAGYVLAHAGWTQALHAQLGAEQRQACHRALARVGERRDDALVAVDHLLSGGMTLAALDRLDVFAERLEAMQLSDVTLNLRPDRVAALFERALDCAEQLGRRPRQICNLRRWLVTFSAAADDRHYFRAAPDWLRQLTRDAGLDAYRALDSSLPAEERLRRALQIAAEQYAATPEAERAYRPDEAMRLLAYYVGASMAVGSRTQDDALLESLPGLLEPFAPLSPLLRAVWQNAIAVVEALPRAQPERGRARWTATFDQLEVGPGAAAQYVSMLRKAIALALASSEARMGLSSARRWLELVAGDRLQGVGALYVRKVLRLQQGDCEGAERCRREAELLAAQTNVRPMLATSLAVELIAHALASDLTGVKQTLDRIEPLAAKYRGWLPFRHLAEGQYQRLRGDLPAARSALERCLALCVPEGPPGERNLWAWVSAIAEYVTVLAQLGRVGEGKAHGLAALDTCARLEIGAAGDALVRAVALVEARLGEFQAANRRLQALLDAQTQLGVSGLHLGASYETGARIAIASGDAEAFERFAQLTAREYRHGEGSALAVHYEHLITEARSVGMPAAAALGDFVSTATAASFGRKSNPRAAVARAMRTAEDPAQRAAVALALLCEARGTSAGHLLLVTDRGLKVAASRGEAALAPETLAQARAYLDAERERCETATIVLAPGGAEQLLTSTWAEQDGVRQRCLPLMTELDGELVYAGIALLAVVARTPDQTGLGELVSALGQYLIEAGDVHAPHSRT